jgi:hypothetical protein
MNEMTGPAFLTHIDLNAEIERFPPDAPSGRRSETLLKTPSLRVVLITMRAGTELHEHVAGRSPCSHCGVDMP